MIMDKRMFEICLDNVYRNNFPIELKQKRRVPSDDEFEKISRFIERNHKDFQEYEAAMLYAVLGMEYFDRSSSGPVPRS